MDALTKTSSLDGPIQCLVSVAGDKTCLMAACSARAMLAAVARCVPPPAAGDGTQAFPLAAALSAARPSASLEEWQHKQSQLLSSLRASVAADLCADAETLVAFAAPLTAAADEPGVDRLSKTDAGDEDEVERVLSTLLTCCAASPAFCEQAASMDLHEVGSMT